MAMPANVINSEPSKWAATAPKAHTVRPDCSSITTSAEKVENVVKPPQKPVVTNSRHSGAKCGYAVKKASGHADDVAADEIRGQGARRNCREVAVEEHGEAPPQQAPEHAAHRYCNEGSPHRLASAFTVPDTRYQLPQHELQHFSRTDARIVIAMAFK